MKYFTVIINVKNRISVVVAFEWNQHKDELMKKNYS